MKLMLWVELVARNDCLPLDVQNDVDEGELVTVAIEAREERGELRCGMSSIGIALGFHACQNSLGSKGKKAISRLWSLPVTLLPCAAES